MANPEVKILSLPAAVTNGAAQSQAVASAKNLTLNGSLVTGGVASLVTAQRVGVVSASAGDTTQTATITGTNRNGLAISEVLTLNGTTTVNTKQDFLTVTQIAISAATAGNINAGTVGVGSSEWIFANQYITPMQVTMALVLLGATAVTATAEYTYDDPNAPAGGYTAYPGPDSVEFASNVPPVAWPVGGLNAVALTAAGTTQADALVELGIFAYRVTINSGTGKVMLQSVQAGVRN